MKRVISGNELKNKMCEAINLLCDTVKTTLGPKGNNIIIDHSVFSPFITNDGVTIAKNIESDDIVINTILELAKEASIKTNDTVGDGTTTTLVLLQSIFNEGIKVINNGINPIILKNELNIALESIIQELNTMSIKPTKKDLLNIATTSSNDDNIGKIITDTFFKVKNINSININEYDNNYSSVIFNKGYYFDTELASLYYFKDNNEININNPYILVFNTFLDDLNIISSIVNDIIVNKKDLILIANDYSDYFINEVISMYMNNLANIYLFKTPEYGINSLIFLNDISLISNTTVINNINDLNNVTIGIINNIKINKEKTYIDFNKSNKINELIKNIKKELNNKNNIIDYDFNNKRLSMLSNITANILVGANTITERRELKMRYDDALCAINTSTTGIVLGSGIPFLKISDNLSIKNNGYKILKISLSKIIEQILNNSGIEINNILDNIRKNNYTVLYNVKNEKFENINNTTIIDPINVIISSLTNAVSIASMLLTTSSLVINECNNSLNKSNDFNEL